MRKIDKGGEPTALSNWKRGNPTGMYGDLGSDERVSIREACTREQYYLCGYCCDSISGNSLDTVNEHVEAQKIAPQRTLDFTNIVASCKSPHSCDSVHKSQPLPLTPFMQECESELRFKLSGRVKGTTNRARETIRVLNLGDTEVANKALIQKRKALCDALLWKNGIDPAEGLDDEELIASVIDDLLQPVNARLDPFAPVLANIMRDWMSK